jgi:hypothetical protein
MLLEKGVCKMKDFEAELNLSGLQIGTLRGGITSVTIQEKDAVGVLQDTHIIRTDRDWQISLNWELRGTMLDSVFFTIPGKWIVKAYLEGWGKGAEELDHAGDTVDGLVVDPAQTIVKAGSLGPQDPPETAWQYAEKFTFLAGSVLPGAYRLAVTINYIDEFGAPGPMAGFIEIYDMVQIYDPGK